MPNKRLRDVVVLLPGITGSVLQKDGKDLWAISGQAAWQALTTLGASLQGMVLEHDDPELDDVGDGIRATRLIPDAHLVPGLVKIDGYSATSRLITNNFDVRVGSIHDDRPANFIEFPYDWRRDARAAARQLKVLIDRRLPQWRKYSGASDARVIFLAHSLGGLVARYYLEVLDGWRESKALITFGTPYRGSVSALNFLANGYKNLFLDLTQVMRSFTSLYQLLPIYEMVKSGATWASVAKCEGIPGVVRERAERAVAFHRRIEAAVKEHRKDAEYRDRGYKILPVVGTHQPTSQSAILTRGGLAVRRELPDCVDELLGDGDGTVPRLSAIPIEMSEEYRDTFVSERHGSLQRNAEVLVDLAARLEQMQVVGLKEIRGPAISQTAAERPAISLDLDDLYLEDEPVELRACVVNADKSLESLNAVIEPVQGQGESRTLAFQEDGGCLVLRIDGCPRGLYRVEVRSSKVGAGSPSSVHDLFEVAG